MDRNKLIAAVFALVVAACATPQKPTPTVSVPEKLKGGANEALAMVMGAKGVQIYECRAAKEPAGSYEWAFVAPEAELFDASGKTVGRHYAGPHWESTDGSKIVGTVKERADAPQSDAIPWLLLSTKPDGPQGSLNRVTSVQRVNTAGGTAPKTGCSQASAGTVVRVPYTADYYFLAEQK